MRGLFLKPVKKNLDNGRHGFSYRCTISRCSNHFFAVSVLKAYVVLSYSPVYAVSKSSCEVMASPDRANTGLSGSWTAGPEMSLGSSSGQSPWSCQYCFTCSRLFRTDSRILRWSAGRHRSEVQHLPLYAILCGPFQSTPTMFAGSSSVKVGCEISDFPSLLLRGSAKDVNVVPAKYGVANVISGDIRVAVQEAVKEVVGEFSCGGF